MPIRHVIVSRRLEGRSILQVLQARLRLPRPLLNQLLRAGAVRLDQRVCHSGQQKVRTGQRLSANVPARTPEGKGTAGGRGVGGRGSGAGGRPPGKRRPPEPAKRRDPLRDFAKIWLPRIQTIYVDDDVLVVNKPAGLTTVRHKDELEEMGRRRKYLPPTLVDLLPLLFKDRPAAGRFRAVHRLDRDTSGLLVLARSDLFERHLGTQFRAHTIERRYLALVRGRATSQVIETYLVRDRGDGRRGSSPIGEGQRALTHVSVAEDLGDYTLVECRLETGRTHQVRIHLGERGFPLCGETIYDRPLHGQPLPDGSGARRPMLHAAFLAFDHPTTGRRLTWTSPLPDDMHKLLTRLRLEREP